MSPLRATSVISVNQQKYEGEAFVSTASSLIASPPRELVAVSPILNISVSESSVISVLSSKDIVSPVLTSTPIRSDEPCVKKARRNSYATSEESTKSLFPTSSTPVPAASPMDIKPSPGDLDNEKKSLSHLDGLNNMVDTKFPSETADVKPNVIDVESYSSILDQRRLILTECSRTAGIDRANLQRKQKNNRPPVLQKTHHHTSSHSQHQQHYNSASLKNHYADAKQKTHHVVHSTQPQQHSVHGASASTHLAPHHHHRDAPSKTPPTLPAAAAAAAAADKYGLDRYGASSRRMVAPQQRPMYPPNPYHVTPPGTPMLPPGLPHHPPPESRYGFMDSRLNYHRGLPGVSPMDPKLALFSESVYSGLSGHRPPLDHRSLDPRSLDPRSLDPRSLDPRSLDPRSLDPRSIDPRTLDPRSLDPRALDPRSLDPRSLDPRSFSAFDPRRSPHMDLAARQMLHGIHPTDLGHHLRDHQVSLDGDETVFNSLHTVKCCGRDQKTFVQYILENLELSLQNLFEIFDKCFFEVCISFKSPILLC